MIDQRFEKIERAVRKILAYPAGPAAYRCTYVKKVGQFEAKFL
jgi:hypothetical protein